MTIIRNTHTHTHTHTQRERECVGKNEEVFVCFSRGYTWIMRFFKRLKTQAEQSHLPHCMRHTNVNLFYLKIL